VNVKQGGYAMCRSSIDFHWIENNNNSVPRIALSFGFLVPMKKVNELYKAPSDTWMSSMRNTYQILLEMYRKHNGYFEGEKGKKFIFGDNEPRN